MTRRMTCSFVLACVLALAGMMLPAFAAPSDTQNVGGGNPRDRLSFRPLRVSRQTRELPYRRRKRCHRDARRRPGFDESRPQRQRGELHGEAVGGVVNAGEGYKWANISGTSNAVISVYLSDDLAKLIQNVGDYHTTGTTLKITGTYHIACPEHEGELDVHASAAEVTDNGGPVTHMVVPGRLEAALALCAVAALFLMLYLLARRYFQRKAQP